MRRNALFILKKAFLYLKNMPTCRDRRPRLSAIAQPDKTYPKPLKRRGCSLTGCYLGIYKRTDEGVCPYFLGVFRGKKYILSGMLIMLFLSKNASLKQHVFILFRFGNRFLSPVFLCSSVFPNPLLWLKLQFPLCLFVLLFIYIYTSLFLNVSIYKYKNTFLFIYLCLSSLLF